MLCTYIYIRVKVADQRRDRSDDGEKKKKNSVRFVYFTKVAFAFLLCLWILMKKTQQIDAISSTFAKIPKRVQNTGWSCHVYENVCAQNIDWIVVFASLFDFDFYWQWMENVLCSCNHFSCFGNNKLHLMVNTTEWQTKHLIRMNDVTINFLNEIDGMEWAQTQAKKKEWSNQYVDAACCVVLMKFYYLRPANSRSSCQCNGTSIFFALSQNECNDKTKELCNSNNSTDGFINIRTNRTFMVHNIISHYYALNVHWQRTPTIA